MDTVVLSWFLMALGVGEMCFGIVLRQRGINLAENESTERRKRALIKAGTFVAISGGVLAFIGVAVQKFGLPS